ncbi:MAG: DUF1684 domain-containing protein [Anaerolineaceae bacterium]|nr:DUF1684 domain-containing protein [Anaerolineaceae bacterium]
MKTIQEHPVEPSNELDVFRQNKDYFFKNHQQSPLTIEQKKIFRGLIYFPENPSLRIEAPITRFEKIETVDMQTSTGQVQPYQRYGRFKFQVEGQEAELTVYRDSNGYFLPFVDALAGKETYPAGRYLEPDVVNNRVIVDFNVAYNPYCAYNERWSCPLAPFENRLKVPIRAGEKNPDF